MDQRRRAPSLYGALWIVLVIALGAVIAVWGVHIGSGFQPHPTTEARPSATPAPRVLTVYSDLGPPNPATLCASIPPSVRVVTVETYTGVVLSRLDCPTS